MCHCKQSSRLQLAQAQNIIFIPLRVTTTFAMGVRCVNNTNLAKLGDGLDESPTVMVGDKKLGKNRGILNSARKRSPAHLHCS